jgi:hypothetical protein
VVELVDDEVDAVDHGGGAGGEAQQRPGQCQGGGVPAVDLSLAVGERQDAEAKDHDHGGRPCRLAPASRSSVITLSCWSFGDFMITKHVQIIEDDRRR